MIINDTICMNEISEKVFFNPGDEVEVRQTLAHKPVMVVKSVEKVTFKDNNKSALYGIKCFWFTNTLEYQEKLFNTKDLSLVKST